jgi:Ankyrin repeats (3 copies)
MWAFGCVLYELITYKVAFPESWNIRDYSLSEVPISVHGPLIPQLPRFFQHHVVQHIHDLLQSKSDRRPRATEIRQIYILYQQILSLPIADTLLNAEKHPSYIQCKEILQSSPSNLDMMLLLTDAFDRNSEHAVAMTLRQHLIKEYQLQLAAYQAKIKLLREENTKLSAMRNITEKLDDYPVGNTRQSLNVVSKGLMAIQRGIVGKKALIHAARVGDIERVKMLLGLKVSTKIKDKYGWTALHYAAEGGHKDVVALLLDKGDDDPIWMDGLTLRGRGRAQRRSRAALGQGRRRRRYGHRWTDGLTLRGSEKPQGRSRAALGQGRRRRRDEKFPTNGLTLGDKGRPQGRGRIAGEGA